MFLSARNEQEEQEEKREIKRRLTRKVRKFTSAGAGEGGRSPAPVTSAGFSGLQLPSPEGESPLAEWAAVLTLQDFSTGARSTQLRDLRSCLMTFLCCLIFVIPAPKQLDVKCIPFSITVNILFLKVYH